MTKTIWYISKYAVAPPYGNATRQFYFSKYFALNGYKTVLISSYSSGIKTIDKIQNEDNYKYSLIDGVHHYLLNGIKINLGFSVKRILSWLQFEWYVFSLCKKLYTQSPPDCVIISSLSLLTILNGIYLKYKYNVKLVFEVRDIWPLTLIYLGGYSKWNPIVLILSLIEKLGYKYADEIVGTMPNLTEHVNSIIHGKNVHYIPHGIDLDFYEKETLSNASISILNSLIRSNVNLVYAGTFGKANGVDFLIETFMNVNKHFPNLNLHLIGEGPLKNEIIQKISKSNAIFIHSSVPKRDVPLLLENFDLNLVFAINSKLYNFGISFNKINEYLLSGVPTVLIYSGYSSMIETADAGYIIRHSDINTITDKFIKILKTNRNILSQKGNNGKYYAKMYLDYNYLSDRYLDILFPERTSIS